MEDVRKEFIDSHLSQLTFQVRDPVRHGELRRLHAEQKFTDLVGAIRKIMNLSMRLRVGLVNSGGINAPAWIEKPVPMPMYGTSEFNRTLVTMYLRKSFLAEFRFEAIVCAIAHELAHVVLSSTNHALQYSEEAVDLTAMILGFRDFYRISSAPTISADGRHRVFERFGYLSVNEINYAANVIATR
jgi:hypothetical protein